MEKRVINAEKRLVNTKHSVRELRQKGFIPGVLYGQKIGSIPIAVPEKELTKMGRAQLLEVSLAGESYPAMIRETQNHPLSGKLRHVDFQQVELDRRISTEIPVHTVGIPAGQIDGGTLQLGERTVEIEALPRDIPEYLEADVAGLAIGDKYTVADLQKTTPLKILTDPDAVIAVVAAPRAAETAETPPPGNGEEKAGVKTGEE